MHKPPTHTVVRDKGITGKFRTRRQWLTGKSVLQVEVVQERETTTCLQVTSRRYNTIWRDATIPEALQVQYGVGFVVVPPDESLPLYRPAAPSVAPPPRNP